MRPTMSVLLTRSPGLRSEKNWRSRARIWCRSPMLPAALHQPTPMRGLQMAPLWTMINPLNAAISIHEMTAACCDDVVIQSHGALRCRATCLLAFSTLIWTFKCSISWPYKCSTSWIVTRWAWAFFLYWLRVFWFRFFLASEFGCVGGGGVGFGCWTGCCSGPTWRSNAWSMAIWNAVIRPRMLMLCSYEKPGIRAWLDCMLRSRLAYWKDRSDWPGSDSVGLPVLMEERSGCWGGVWPVGLQALVGERLDHMIGVATICQGLMTIGSNIGGVE